MEVYYIVFFLISTMLINAVFGKELTYYFLLLVLVSVFFFRFKEIDGMVKHIATKGEEAK